ncbi:MAG: Lrp/AsnC family transcriptional regulator [Magnetococcales bacterium]|nr:Lrp/AsnC family transcriptional regulator [Magnetococcales bacterium]
MDPLSRRIINGLQTGFPLTLTPFAQAGANLDLTEESLIQTIQKLLEEGLLSRFGPLYNAERMGGGLTLAALAVPADRDFEQVAEVVNAFPQVAHNYARDHTLNMWFVVATETPIELTNTLAEIENRTGLAVFNLPKLTEYRLGFQVGLDEQGGIDTVPLPERPPAKNPGLPDEIDLKIIRATQGGLPLVVDPYHQIARTIGMEVEALIERLKGMLEKTWIRRIGVVPNHYRLGLKANGMSVWILPEERIDALGKQIGALGFVSHCYRRPQRLPEWPYNLFVMVHGQEREVVTARVEEISTLLGAHDRGHQILYSSRILKKTGLRFG